ncbi:Cdc6/Cdc18 family protein, partial [Halobellus captivus]|uniref:Cdc6/Cdc18 family protein n=1 Tax=Halobellus captivus TaxID=2592614 RepID=UPI001EF03033
MEKEAQSGDGDAPTGSEEDAQSGESTKSDTSTVGTNEVGERASRNEEGRDFTDSKEREEIGRGEIDHEEVNREKSDPEENVREENVREGNDATDPSKSDDPSESDSRHVSEEGEQDITGNDEPNITGNDEPNITDNEGDQNITAEDIDIEASIGPDDPSSISVGSAGTAETDVSLDEVVLDDDGDSQGLFDDLLSGEPIFENKEVLRPSYTPHELPHRTEQINQMATILVSALRGETPSNILIYGKTGTGKTASAKFVSQELESTSKKYDVPCEVEYINCEVTDTQYRVLAQLANKFIEKNRELIEGRLDHLNDLRSRAENDPSALGDTAYESRAAVSARIDELESDRDEMEPVPMTGWPTDRVYTTFFDAVDYEERVVVIMLDEIDKLVEKSGDDTLYNLSRMNSELTNSRISIMGISNDLKFTDFLDPRVKSSLGE